MERQRDRDKREAQAQVKTQTQTQTQMRTQTTDTHVNVEVDCPAVPAGHNAQAFKIECTACTNRSVGRGGMVEGEVCEKEGGCTQCSGRRSSGGCNATIDPLARLVCDRVLIESLHHLTQRNAMAQYSPVWQPPASQPLAGTTLHIPQPWQCKRAHANARNGGVKRANSAGAKHVHVEKTHRLSISVSSASRSSAARRSSTELHCTHTTTCPSAGRDGSGAQTSAWWRGGERRGGNVRGYCRRQ